MRFKLGFLRLHNKELRQLETEIERMEDPGAHLDESHVNIFACAKMTREEKVDLSESERSK